MLEDALPFAEDEIGREHERFAFIAFAEKSKQHLHFIAILLNIAQVIENDSGELVERGRVPGEDASPVWPRAAVAPGSRWAARGPDGPGRPVHTQRPPARGFSQRPVCRRRPHWSHSP